VLLAIVKILDADAPKLALKYFMAAILAGRYRKHAPLYADPAAAATANRANDDRAAAVDVAVEQRVERHYRVIVARSWVDEINDDAGLLAWVATRNTANSLLVDPF
jgi:aromatic ring-cleaving dioxygenase